MQYRALLLALSALLAAPAFAQKYVTHCSVDASEALRRINAARAAGHSCGWHRMPPAPPLRWDGALQSAAAGHSRDMAQRNYFDHRSPEGRTVRLQDEDGGREPGGRRRGTARRDPGLAGQPGALPEHDGRPVLGGGCRL